MTHYTIRAGQTGVSRTSALSAAAGLICVAGLAFAIVIKAPHIPSQAVAATHPESGSAATPSTLPSSAQAKTWDRVEYAPGDFEPRPGQIQD